MSSTHHSIETHAAIYSASLIVMFKLVQSCFSHLPGLMKTCIYQGFVIFLAGICVKDKNQSAAGIASFFGLKSHDALSKMLMHKSWSATILMLQLLNKAIELSLNCPMPSRLILDDVILHKRRSRHTDGVYWDYDYVNGCNVLCLRLVVVAWSNGVVCLPVAFACYQREGCPYLKKHRKKFRSKNQLARALVYQLVKKGLHFDYLTFDSWYASKENFLFFNKLNIAFVTALKSNRKLRMLENPLENKPKRRTKNVKWQTLTCTEWAAQKPYVRQYGYYAKVDVRARQSLVFLKGVPCHLKLVCIKNYVHNKAFKSMVTKSEKKGKDPNKYLITNNIMLTVPQVIEHYRRRWAIEVLFRDCKQHLALGKCQAHKALETHLRHTAIVFLAYTILELMKLNCAKSDSTRKTIGDLKKDLQRQQIIWANGRYLLVDSSRSGWDWGKVDLLTPYLDFDDFDGGETRLVFNSKT